MMKAKIIPILILLVAGLVSCDKETKVEDSTIFSLHQKSASIGFVESDLKITKDYTFYSFSLKQATLSEDVEYSDKIETSNEVWNTLVKSFDLATFTKIKSGESNIPVDGGDAVFSVTIGGKEYSFLNGYDDEHYKQMQEFFDAMYDQLKYFENKQNMVEE